MNGKCSELLPVTFDCVECGGKGCTECNGSGKWEHNDCPRKLLDMPTVEVLRFARFARDGSWPVDGGMLSQTEKFMDACRLIWSEQDIAEAEMIKRGR